ncbi:hypothetical protein HETIRDRAFT_439412 [Heterobasidion irregulare TC 32-1]|uniref:Secreted protein n=1 Tax=Heterobasidion irregulare (strain TC 32-1) TaxID=747525 RepID=W4K9L1_HETIT|nr:uncharacterized protein HETIRDRAFT_439412 [Heterobasidion irregulare TC 32-1]ETW82429.1 hypothetical protein HETIRDRAFT_439412 [Heterobasidion irregulare TC 32-1]
MSVLSARPLLNLCPAISVASLTLFPLAHSIPSIVSPASDACMCDPHLRPSFSPACTHDLSALPLVDPSFTPPSSRPIVEASRSTPRTLDLSFVNCPTLDLV